MKLNLGCGANVVNGWVNVDYSFGVRMVRIPFVRMINRHLRLFDIDWDARIVVHDLTRPFPWPNDSTSVIYMSHTLEHFDRNQMLRVLSECHRVLMPGGVIRILVPDLACIVNRYRAGDLNAEDFVESLGVFVTDSPSQFKKRLYPLIQFPHRCMFDEPALLRILGERGLPASNKEPFKSDIPDITTIEREERTREAVIVEGRKPLGEVNRTY